MRYFLTILLLILFFGLSSLLIDKYYNKPVYSDAACYKAIAESILSEGKYNYPSGFWGNVPTTTRMPGWPFAMSLVMKLESYFSSDSLVRALSITLHVCYALLAGVIAWYLFQNKITSILTPIVAFLHPGGLYFAFSADCEPLFIVLCMTGVICILAGGKKDEFIGVTSKQRIVQYLGFLFLGLSVLVRANFLPWIFLIIIFLIREKCILKRKLLFIAVGAIIFVFPVSMWIIRNHAVSGDYVVSSIRGQTFYGGNNSMVSEFKIYWGYWVFPDALPSEKSMKELSATMSEVEVDRYYMSKGIDYLRNNPGKVPQLVLGKLVRAYLPIPFKPAAGTIIVSIYRWFIIVAAIYGIRMLWNALDGRYRIIILSLLGTNLIMVVGFWGCARFAYGFEVFMIPIVAEAMVRIFMSKCIENGRYPACRK